MLYDTRRYVPGRRRPRLSAPHRTACARLTRPAGLASSPFAFFIAGRDRLDLSSAPRNSYNSWELSSGGLKGHAGAGDVAAAAADGDVAAADDGDDETGIDEDGSGASVGGEDGAWWWWVIPGYRHAYALNADNSILCCSNLGR